MVLRLVVHRAAGTGGPTALLQLQGHLMGSRGRGLTLLSFEAPQMRHPPRLDVTDPSLRGFAALSLRMTDAPKALKTAASMWPTSGW